MKAWYSASELAELGLPELPVTRSGVIRRARDENWRCRPRVGQGGGKEYHFGSLPQRARRALERRFLEAGSVEKAPDQLPKPAEPLYNELFASGSSMPSRQVQAPTDLAGWQMRSRDARAAILAAVDQRALVVGQKLAVDEIVMLARTGRLPEPLNQMVCEANARGGKAGHRTLSRSGIYAWLKTRDESGVAALAPLPPPDAPPPRWAAQFLKFWADPRKPSIKQVLPLLIADLPETIEPPSYDQLRYYLKKLPPSVRNRGRLGPKELKKYLPFVRRTIDELLPTDVYASDGHTFKALVENPASGKPFRPEVTAVIDVATRYVVGWSTGLAENSIGVLDALSGAMLDRDDGRKHGVPAIWYTDNGRGFRNELFEDQATGFYARHGITAKNALPYNSQARGVIERLHKTLFIPLAKQLVGYQGRDMDREAGKSVVRLIETTENAISDGLVPGWHDFRQMVQHAVDAYNRAPHSTLAQIRDPDTGTKRHLSPLEAWEAAEADGFTAVTVPQEQAADLLRPYVRRTVRRCEVRWLNYVYFSRELEPFDGQEVMVGFDVHDAAQVYVRDFDNRLLAVAAIDGNSVPFFAPAILNQARDARAAKSFADKRHEGRVIGRIKRAEKKADLAREEMPEILPFTIDQGPGPEEPERLAAAEAALAKMAQDPDHSSSTAEELPQGGRPVFHDEFSWINWLINNPEKLNEFDRRQLTERLRNPRARELFAMYGIDVERAQRLVA